MALAGLALLSALIASGSFARAASARQCHWVDKQRARRWLCILAGDRSSNPATLYVGTLVSVYKSTDGGGTWRSADTGISDYWIEAMDIDPQDPYTLYLRSTGNGVYKSIDGGGSWNAINNGFEDIDGRIYQRCCRRSRQP